MKNNNEPNKSPHDKNEDYVEKIQKLLKRIKYGSITLFVQDGIITEIVTSEKIKT
ncbi:YezD family protein [Clostridium sp. DMHC 10]|uniref:YezD family protein n=1 Tax=Clostridium sp. DMHC 10 TaxID=747377 RepID=UPI000A0090AA|nr:YezD family protein [Clostridium sp. DMHC 10]